MNAEFSGYCACCDYKYPPGTAIEYSNEYGGWVISGHPRKAEPICPTCFMQRSASGACGCE